MKVNMKKFFITLICLFVFAGTCYAETVIFNTKTLKYHNINCHHAQKCTQSCIKIEKQKAKAKGGVPCKTCGG